MFDLATLDTRTRAEAGAPMTVRNPRTGAPVLNGDGQEVTITLLGRGSQTYEDVQRRMLERRVERQAQGVRISAEDTYAEDTAILAACTKGWTFEALDGQPFPCTPENVNRLWNDRRFPWLRDAAIAFLSQHGNFLST